MGHMLSKAHLQTLMVSEEDAPRRPHRVACHAPEHVTGTIVPQGKMMSYGEAASRRLGAWALTHKKPRHLSAQGLSLLLVNTQVYSSEKILTW